MKKLGPCFLKCLYEHFKKAYVISTKEKEKKLAADC